MAEYIKSEKNKQVSTFYDALGFRQTILGEYLVKYEILVADYRASCINYIEVNDAVE